MRFQLPARFQVPRDVDEELRFHFEARIEELIARGATREAASAQALAEFGDVHDVRANLQAINLRMARQREGRLLDTLRQDVRYAIRSLLRTPAVALTIIITLALGVGANAAMFSLLDVIFLRPPSGVANAEDVRRIWADRRFRSGRQFWSGYDYPSYAALEQSLTGKADLAIYGSADKLPLGRGDTPPTVNVSAASASFFRILGVKPALGRFYDVDEERLDAGVPVVVLADRLWRREFDADRGVIGRVAIIAQQPFTIIGVAPPGFSGVELDAADAWIPLASNPEYNKAARIPWYRDANVNAFQVLLRARPGSKESELEQRSTIALRRLGIGYRQDTTVVARFGSLVRARGPGKLSAAVQVAERAGGVAVIVLLIAFANVVNLLLARAVRRRREIAVRLALGVSSLRLIRMLVTESVLLAVAASAAALAAASWGGMLLRKLLMPEITWADNPLHWRVLLLGVGAAVITGAIAGLVPALQSRAPDLTQALKAGTREGGSHRSPLRGFLVAAQAALSVMLLAGAALFLRSLSNVKRLDIGYAVDRLAFVSVSSGSDRARQAQVTERLLQLEERFAGVPGVERVAYTTMQPIGGIQFTEYFPDGWSLEKPRSGFFTAVSPDFFSATGTRILRGRTFASGAEGRAEQAVLINKLAADSLWPNQDALGRCIRFEKADAACYRVIGVTQTAVLTGIKDKLEPHVYLPIANMPFARRDVDVVLRIDPARLSGVLTQIGTIVRSEFPAMPVTTNTMTATMEPQYRPWQLGAVLFTLFGALAALVAAIGVYSTVSYAVSQRAHEFGVRVALGATGRRIVTQVVGEGVRTVTMGVLVGIVLALLAGRVMASLLYGVSPRDPGMMLVAGGILLAIAAAASFGPAWRAGRADPVSALRTD